MNQSSTAPAEAHAAFEPVGGEEQVEPHRRGEIAQFEVGHEDDAEVDGVDSECLGQRRDERHHHIIEILNQSTSERKPPVKFYHMNHIQISLFPLKIHILIPMKSMKDRRTPSEIIQ